MPPRIARDVPAEDGRYPPPFDQELLSAGRDLAEAAGAERLGCWREHLPPGRRTSRLHAHLREEELVYVIAGAPVVRWRDADGTRGETELQAGDLVSFPAGTGLAHTVFNPGPDAAELLVVGERHAGERVLYPDDPDLVAWRATQWPDRTWDLDEPGVGWPYRLRTPRLVLRPWEPSEAPGMAGLLRANRERLAPWMAFAVAAASPDELLVRIRGWRAAFDREEDLLLGVFTPEGRPIGGTGLHLRIGPRAAEIGYWIDHRFEGKGLVTEAVAALVRTGFEVLGLDRLEIHCAPENARSAVIPRRLGFQHEATLPRRYFHPHGPQTSMIWTMYAADFGASPAATLAVDAVATDALGRRYAR